MVVVFDLLRAEGPADEFADELMLYGRLVGSWRVAAEWYSADGSV